ncbi:unnamed protein product [Closterium sp. NIES-64]|nr:unnamed protein product [Closterium sp. NIES-64]
MSRLGPSICALHRAFALHRHAEETSAEQQSAQPPPADEVDDPWQLSGASADDPGRSSGVPLETCARDRGRQRRWLLEGGGGRVQTWFWHRVLGASIRAVELQWWPNGGEIFRQSLIAARRSKQGEGGVVTAPLLPMAAPPVAGVCPYDETAVSALESLERTGHSATEAGTWQVIIGGLMRSGQAVMDVVLLNTATMAMRHPLVHVFADDSPPLPRFRHTAVPVRVAESFRHGFAGPADPVLFVFGGYNLQVRAPMHSTVLPCGPAAAFLNKSRIKFVNGFVRGTYFLATRSLDFLPMARLSQTLSLNQPLFPGALSSSSPPHCGKQGGVYGAEESFFLAVTDDGRRVVWRRAAATGAAPCPRFHHTIGEGAQLNDWADEADEQTSGWDAAEREVGEAELALNESGAQARSPNGTRPFAHELLERRRRIAAQSGQQDPRSAAGWCAGGSSSSSLNGGASALVRAAGAVDGLRLSGGREGRRQSAGETSGEHAESGDSAGVRAGEAEGAVAYREADGESGAWGTDEGEGGAERGERSGEGAGERAVVVYVLDVARMAWRRVVTRGRGPGVRFLHYACTHSECEEGRERLVVFGGYREKHEEMEDMQAFTLDLMSMMWTPPPRLPPACAALLPLPRHRSGITKVGPDQVLLMEGTTYGTRDYLSDAYLLNLHTLHWSPVRVHGAAMAGPSAGHSVEGLLLVGGCVLGTLGIHPISRVDPLLLGNFGSPALPPASSCLPSSVLAGRTNQLAPANLAAEVVPSGAGEAAGVACDGGSGNGPLDLILRVRDVRNTVVQRSDWADAGNDDYK